MINRIVSVTERSERRGTRAGQTTGGEQDRWVQFGAVSASRIDFGDGIVSQRLTSETLLNEYLALPVDRYSLLDPKWIRREQQLVAEDDAAGYSNVFRLSVPLHEVIGIDLSPSISVAAHPDPEEGSVTLIGSRAALGSPSLDESFKVNLVAVLRQPSRSRARWRRNIPNISAPDHLPGRPVYRLRRWAARARGREWPKNHPSEVTTEPMRNQSVDEDMEGENLDRASSIVAPSIADDGDLEEDAAETADVGILDMNGLDTIDIDDPISSAPFPSERLYITHAEDSSGDVVDEVEDLAFASHHIETAKRHTTSAETEVQLEGSHSAACDHDGISIDQSQKSFSLQKSDRIVTPTILQCRVNVTVAIRVPRPLRVVPNPLLGYAGSLILRSVLSATLPNFLNLLKSDFSQWVEDSEERDCFAATGELFPPAK